MAYENTDDINEYKTACENAKKIVNEIKSLKIKYYLDFSKISEEDNKRYNQLLADLKGISEKDTNVGRLVDELMNEINARYSEKNAKQDFQDTSKGVLVACYGAIDAERQALKDGNIADAIKCRRRLNEYLKTLDLDSYNEVLLYRRGKFNDLSKDDEERANNNSKWSNEIKACCRDDLANDRAKAVSHIKEVEKDSRSIFAGIVNQNGETR